MLYPLVRIGLPQTGIQLLKVVAPALLRTVIVMLLDIFLAEVLATMLPVESVALVLVIILPATVASLVTVI
jgi:hypothetical protein